MAVEGGPSIPGVDRRASAGRTQERGSFQSMPLDRLIAAESAFGMSMLRRFIDMSASGSALPQPGEGQGVTFLHRRATQEPAQATTPPAETPSDVSSKVSALLTDYQRQGDGTVVSIKSGLFGDLDREKGMVFDHVAGLSDEEFARFEKRTAREVKRFARRNRKTLPEAPDLLNQSLLANETIQAHVVEQQKNAAEILSDVVLFNAMIGDMKRHVDPKHVRRDKKDAYDDLSGLLTAYEDIQDGVVLDLDTDDSPRAQYHRRVHALMERVEEKTKAVEDQSAQVPVRDINEYLQGTDRAAQILMMRRLRKGDQRELFADRHDYDTAKVKKESWRTFGRQGLHFGGENGLALAGGILAQWALQKVGMPHIAEDAVSSVLEGAMMLQFLRGGKSNARSIRKNGYSTQVGAVLMHDFVSRLTNNKFLVDSATAGTYAGTNIGLDIALWGPIYTALATAGFTVTQLFGVGFGANLTGIGYEEGLIRHRNKSKVIRYDAAKLRKDPVPVREGAGGQGDGNS